MGKSTSWAETRHEQDLPIVDTHQHLWDLTKFTLPWHAELKDSPLSTNFLPADYDQATASSHVVQSVYMEVDVAEHQQNAEADFVLELCRKPESKTKAAVISGRPGEKTFANYMQRFASEPLIKGVRQVLHGSTTPAGFCTRPQFVSNIQLLGEMNKSFDLCMRSSELMDGVRLVDQCSKTRFILDHCGNGPVQVDDARPIAIWKQGIKELAARPNVVCKISGIVASASKEWQPADLAPVINYCLDSFGEDRVMFAGDWPVCLLRATFETWVKALKSIVANRSKEFQRKLFHDNAIQFYGLKSTAKASD